MLNPTQPTAFIVIGGNAIAFEEETGEILESDGWNSDGTPDWSNAGICDHRGGGGEQGFLCLSLALMHSEANATLCGLKVRRVPRERATHASL